MPPRSRRKIPPTCAVPCVEEAAGFLFLNNYQDHVEMQDLEGLRFEVCAGGETITIPRTQTLTLKKNVSAILPFGLSLNGICLRSATAQLLAKLDSATA